MKTRAQRTVQLGELVVAAFDSAASYGADPREVSRLATCAVMAMLRHARMTTNRPLLRLVGGQEIHEAVGRGGGVRGHAPGPAQILRADAVVADRPGTSEKR